MFLISDQTAGEGSITASGASNCSLGGPMGPLFFCALFRRSMCARACARTHKRNKCYIYLFYYYIYIYKKQGCNYIAKQRKKTNEQKKSKGKKRNKKESKQAKESKAKGNNNTQTTKKQNAKERNKQRREKIEMPNTKTKNKKRAKGINKIAPPRRANKPNKPPCNKNDMASTACRAKWQAYSHDFACRAACLKYTF